MVYGQAGKDATWDVVYRDGGSQRDWGSVRGGECEVEGERDLMGLPSIAARSLDTGRGRLIAPLLRAWPFSVAPRPLGPTFRPRGSSKCSSWPPAGPRGLALPPGCPPLQTVSGDRRPPPGSGRRAPPWVVGGSPADALCGKRLLLPARPARRDMICVPALSRGEARPMTLPA